MFSIYNTAAITLIMFMLQKITMRSKEQYLDTLAGHNHDKESFLLLLESLVKHSHLS